MYKNIHSDPYNFPYKKQEDPEFSYWFYLKLRIGFSLFFLFFLILSSHTLHIKEIKQVQSVFQQINQMDPYTKKFLQDLKTIK